MIVYNNVPILNECRTDQLSTVILSTDICNRILENGSKSHICN